MLNLKNVSLRRATRLLFEQATLTIHRGQKVGVTGGNGCGKSSLFSMILDHLHPDVGELSVQPGIVIAHVAQELLATNREAVEFVMDGDIELRKIESAIAEADQMSEGTRLAELHAELDRVGGYTAHSRAARLMSGLGFSVEEERKAVSSFSGGWRVRLNLAQALMCRSDLLLLDEPTNHLDLDAVIWLQDWLQSYRGTLLLISHDRDFLDSIADSILNIEHQNLSLFSGNYSQFERTRAERLSQQQADYTRQQKEIAHIKKFVDRFRAQATKARQAQSRLKALERMELIAAAHSDSPFHFSFRQPDYIPNPLVSIDKVATGYGEATTFKNVSLAIRPGDRIGLLGPNGAGKSTLIKLLAGELKKSAGNIIQAERLKIGYFAQHQLEQLDANQSPLDHIQQLDRQARELDLRNFLGGFGFKGDRVLEPVAPFSGGEKARLVLALLVYQKPNLLLLDEPTNHLDLEMRHALSTALQSYSGAMIVVSHDRHLLRTVTDQFLLVYGGQVVQFDGDLDDYAQWLKQNTACKGEPSSSSMRGANTRKKSKQERAEERRKLKPLQDKLKKTENRLEKLYSKRLTLEEKLADGQLYEKEEKEHLKKTIGEKFELDQRIKEAEEAWLSAQDAIEVKE